MSSGPMIQPRTVAVIGSALLVVVLVAALVPSCTEIPAPKGYVPLEHPVSPVVLDAVASTGNRYQVREHENPEGASLSFWVDAIRRELVQGRGYELLSDDPLTAEEGARGRELHFGALHQLERYRYVLGVFVDGDRVVVCEAGGTESELAPDLEELRAAMQRVGGEPPES